MTPIIVTHLKTSCVQLDQMVVLTLLPFGFSLIQNKKIKDLESQTIPNQVEKQPHDKVQVFLCH